MENTYGELFVMHENLDILQFSLKSHFNKQHGQQHGDVTPNSVAFSKLDYFQQTLSSKKRFKCTSSRDRPFSATLRLHIFWEILFFFFFFAFREVVHQKINDLSSTQLHVVPNPYDHKKRGCCFV